MEEALCNWENWDKNNIKWKHGYIESKAYKKIECYMEIINYCRLYKIRLCRSYVNRNKIYIKYHTSLVQKYQSVPHDHSIFNK